MNSSTASPLEKFKGALSSAGKKFKNLSGNQWEAQCPAHDDTRASLGFKEADHAGTKLLVHCQVGCATQDVVRALGLHMRDLFPQAEEDRDRRPRAHRGELPARARPDVPSRGAPHDPAPLRRARRGLGREVARYKYVDEKGELQFCVVRFEPKDFRQGSPDPSKPGGISWGLKGKSVRQVIYRLPLVRAAIDRGTTIFVVEGEKDVEALEQLGVVATCNAGGAGKWRDSHTECLKGAKRVVIVPDRDEPGAAHAAAVANALTGVAEQVLVMQLPGDVKDAADWVAAGGTAEQLASLAADAPSAQDWVSFVSGSRRAISPATINASALPAIMLTDRQFRDVEDGTWAAIQRTNNPPRFFIRGGQLAHIIERDGFKQIDLITDVQAFGLLARVATWLRLSKNGDVINASPSRDVAKQVVVRPCQDLPELRDMVRAPTFDEAGRLVMAPGYDVQAKVWVELPSGLVMPQVKVRPGPEDLASARTLLLDNLLGDFPFEAESDLAHALALILGPITRRLVNGPTPMHAIEAPSPGSGKGLLADVASIINTGAVCVPTTIPTSADEMRKKITALLRRGPAMLLWDNVRDEVDSAELASVLTNERWQDRILGVSEDAILPNRTIWVLTANNPSFSEEIARRTIRIRLDPKRDRPWLRSDFKHPDLRTWATESRGRLLHAALTLVRAWVAEGMPPSANAKPLGSFERWSRVMGGILDVAGVPGFLGNQDEMYELADAKGHEQREFVAAWWERYGPTKLKASELLKLVVQQSLLPSEVDKTSHQGRLTQLSCVLRGMRGRRFGDLAIAVDPDTHSKASWYSLRRAGDGVAAAGGES